MTGADATVVICAYADRRWPWLQAAVASVHEQEHPSRELVVVVDHNDRLLERAGRELSGAVVLPNVGPVGLSGARNTGVAAANGAFLAFLDDDAAAQPGWLSRLLAPYDDPAVAGVGGRAEPIWPAERPRWWPPEFDWVVGCSYQGLPATTAPVRNLMGCNMSFRREVFERVGAFAPGIGRVGTQPLGCEETELCIRVAKAWPGSRFVYEPQAVVSHRVDPARVGLRYFGRRCHAEGRSKAVVSRRVGVADALSTERRYLRGTVPCGLRRDVGALVRRGDLDGARRVACTLVGLAAAGIGFAGGSLVTRSSR